MAHSQHAEPAEMSGSFVHPQQLKRPSTSHIVEHTLGYNEAPSLPENSPCIIKMVIMMV